MVRDQPHLEELAGIVSTGLLAEGIVFGTSRLIRGEALRDDEREALAGGKALLEFAAAPIRSVTTGAGLQPLSPEVGALEALQVMRSEDPDVNVEDFVRPLIEVLDLALNDVSVSGRKNELERIQRLFVSLGHVALARANSVSYVPEERIAWPAVTKIAIS